MTAVELMKLAAELEKVRDRDSGHYAVLYRATAAIVSALDNLALSVDATKEKLSGDS